MLEGDLPIGRTWKIVADTTHPNWFQIPLPQRAGSGKRRIQFFRPQTERPENEIKARLVALLRCRPGFGVGDLFETPWGNFQVTKTFGIKSA
jgi:hypothetical protein